jgi:hypothetical protein
VVVVGAEARHGGHGDAIGELDAANAEGSEEFGHFGFFIYIVNGSISSKVNGYDFIYILSRTLRVPKSPLGLTSSVECGVKAVRLQDKNLKDLILQEALICCFVPTLTGLGGISNIQIHHPSGQLTLAAFPFVKDI